MSSTHQYIRCELPEGDPFPVASGQCVAKLDQNESPRDLPDNLKARITSRLTSSAWTRYPQPETYRLAKSSFAEALGVDPDCLAITNGCDGAIQGVHFLAGGGKRRGLCFTPTYPMLSHAGYLAGTNMRTVLAGPDYQIDPSEFHGYDLILLANPNNPTGTLTEDCVIEKALDTDALVFLDEAYFDFSQKTWLPLLGKYQNLCIGRSCSKAMMAGLRIGALISNPKVIRVYESLVTAPYHLSHLQLIVAEMYAEVLPHVKTITNEIRHERESLRTGMNVLGVETYASATNFILFKVNNPEFIFRELLNNGIRIRNMQKIPGLQSHLRVTVGKPDENSLFLDALANAIDGVKS